MIAAQMNPAAMTREAPGKWGSLVLTACIHGALVLLLFYGVQWQTRPPEPVQVDLVRSLPPPVAVETPVPVPPPKPIPVPKEVEPPPLKKPDIALPKPPEKPVIKEKPPVEPPKPVEKPLPKPQEKPPEPAKPQISARELEAQRQHDLLLMESDKARRQIQAQTNAVNKADRDSATARVNGRSEAEWIDAITQKVRGNLSAAAPQGNPEAVFAIELFPTGEVGAIRLQRTSGNKALDEAMERAIRSSSPLPLPSRPDVFQRNLRFVFKPRGD
ncbi:MAG: energy transducer TonB [Rhodocyclales bacterium]|nr:energy transducer TonB [Rhodocyclales bacterium]